MSGSIRVHRAKHSSRTDGRRNWLVDDSTGGKVFVHRFTFSCFSFAITEADRLARTGLIHPRGLFGAHRITFDEATS